MRNLGLKVAYRLDDIKAIKQGEFPFPKSLTVFPSEVCNLNCPGCNSSSIHHKNGFMDFELFKEIIDDFHKHEGKAVAFEGGGEPMLHPEIDKFINYADSYGLKLGIITNGTIFKTEMLKAQWIRVSINNSFSPEMKENLKKMLTHRLFTSIGIKLMRTRGNPQPKIKLYPKPDYVQIKDWRHHEYSAVTDPEYTKPCGITPLRAVVDWDGTFYPCPYFWKHKNPIGKRLLSDFWGNDKHKDAIAKIKNCNWFDCPLLEIDWNEIQRADLEFI